MNSSFSADVDGQTHIGMLRQVNEDSLLVDINAGLFAIADGMGGHGSGDVASKLAIDTLQHCITANNVTQALSNADISDKQALQLVTQCIADVNQTIFVRNEQNGHPDGTGMGTTLVGLCKFGDANRAITFNVGDSRLYTCGENGLTQLTRDHTMYREWEETGRIGPAPSRNIIMRAMGLFADVDMDLDVISLSDTDSYLLCSDGLTGMVDDDEIATIFSLGANAAITSQTLIDTANKHGGTDNISVITIRPHAET